MLDTLDRVYTLLRPPVYRLSVSGDLAVMVVDGFEGVDRLEEASGVYCLEAGGERHCYGELDEVLLFVTGRRLVAFAEVGW